MESPGNWTSVKEWTIYCARGESITTLLERAASSRHGLAGWANRYYSAVNPVVRVYSVRDAMALTDVQRAGDEPAYFLSLEQVL